MPRDMTIAEAAQRMGKNPQFIRLGLQSGRLPFGWAVQTSKSSWSYWIGRKKFFELTGLPDMPLSELKEDGKETT